MLDVMVPLADELTNKQTNWLPRVVQAGMANLCCLVPDCYQKLVTIASGASLPRLVNLAVRLLLDICQRPLQVPSFSWF
jgi:hypothetical protein